MPIDYDPFSPEMLADPYPTYARLRREAPVYRLPQYHAVALSRFEDIWQVIGDAAHFTILEAFTTCAHSTHKIISYKNRHHNLYNTGITLLGNRLFAVAGHGSQVHMGHSTNKALSFVCGFDLGTQSVHP